MTDEQKAAWVAAFSGPNGHHLADHLAIVQSSFLGTSDSGALQVHEGRRRFAAELLALAPERHLISMPRPAKQPAAKGLARRVPEKES